MKKASIKVSNPEDEILNFIQEKTGKEARSPKMEIDDDTPLASTFVHSSRAPQSMLGKQ